MAKIITFSRVFPSYHPKKGQPTLFVEKLAASFSNLKLSADEWTQVQNTWKYLDKTLLESFDWTKYLNSPKNHTIRSGHRFKVEDKFSPRIWSDKPYRSKMITIAPDIEIKKVWSFEIKSGNFYIDKICLSEKILIVSKNDGLSYEDFTNWFKYPKDFNGQIICWNENIIY